MKWLQGAEQGLTVLSSAHPWGQDESRAPLHSLVYDLYREAPTRENHGHLVFPALRYNLQYNFKSAFEVGILISGKIRFGQLVELIGYFIIYCLGLTERGDSVL